MKGGKNFNIKVSVRNGRLLSAIRAKYDSVSDLSRQLIRGKSQLGALVRMKLKPFNHKGWTDLALDVAAMVGKEPEELWPEHLRELQLLKATSEMEVGLDSVKSIMQDGSTEKTLAQFSAISDLSSGLTPRECRCISLRFALHQSLEQTSKAMGVTRERARQIECKALRKMRGYATKRGYRTRHTWETEEALTSKGLDLFTD